MPYNKERYMFERAMTKAELMTLRNWEAIANRRGWKGFPEDKLGKVRLYIHEVFSLESWRERDGGKKINLVKITVRPNTRFFVFGRH
jgi:hypothetical protein